MMKTREEAVRLIERQFKVNYKCSREKGYKHHYGLQELRELMDFIYESKPKSESEQILNSFAWGSP